jgi:hypothetical protein
MLMPEQDHNKKELTPEQRQKNRRYFGVLCLNTVLFFLVYRFFLTFAELTDRPFGSFVVMVVYMALLLVFVIAYLVYNRFFYRSGVTREQLSPEWSEEQKTDFLEDAQKRVEKSKWMLTVIFPLVVTFLIDAVELFIVDPFLR